MKKSIEILGLPVISITEGRELGISKSLLIDAKNGLVAAITIEDDDWYRGVKLIPYESVIAIGTDAVTITHSENILKLEDAGDYEALLEENIRVIGTKAITKNGMIQGTVTEIFVGDDGRIERCEITSPDGTALDVTAEQISIFGKQVTVIDAELEKKTELIIDEPEDAVYEEPAAEESAVDATEDKPSEPGIDEEALNLMLAEIAAKEQRAIQKLKDADVQANILKQQAENERKQLLDEAKAEIEKAKADAKKAGRDEGLKEGQKKGHDEGVKAAKKELANAIKDANAQAEKTLRDAKEATADYFVRAERSKRYCRSTSLTCRKWYCPLCARRSRRYATKRKSKCTWRRIIMMWC